MSVCVRSAARRCFGSAYTTALLFVVGAISTGLTLGYFASSASKPKTAAVVTKTAVLQDSDWLSESYWQRRRKKKLRSNNFSAPSQLGFNPFGQPVGDLFPRQRSFGGGNYRTVCVRLCDGYYFPISFSTSRSRLAQDEQACKSKCSSGARLFYYRNSDGSPETMIDRRGRAYAKLKTAFLYRTNYDKSCQCRPDPWSDAAKQRHAMYATKDWQRKARRLARKERKRARYVRRSVRAEGPVVMPPGFPASVGVFTPTAFSVGATPRKRYSQARIRRASKKRRPRRRSRSKNSWKSFMTNH